MTIANTNHEDLFANEKLITYGLASLKIQMAPKSKTGISGGYIKKLSGTLPSINNVKDRCAPQVGQSMPKSCLYAQGNIHFGDMILDG